MEIIFKPHTVITLVGPSHSGKTTFAKSAAQFLKDSGKTVKILSSDEIRRELLNLSPEQPIPQVEGFGVSEQTFIKLFNDLRAYTATPINTDVIIVDTTGIDTTFRKDIARVAGEQGYSNIAIVFNPSKEQLKARMKGTEEEIAHTETYVSRQLKRMREQVLPKFNKHDYLQTYRVTEKVTSFELSFDDYGKVIKGITGTWIAYGDIHQSYEEFQNLLLRNSAAHPFATHVVNGDWTDKGDEASLLTTINVLHNYAIGKKIPELNVILIKGNHEEYVYRHLIDPVYVFEECKETEYFTSLRFLTDPKNATYRQLFIELYEASVDFIELRSNRFWGIISHSPCEAKYLGKRSPKAIKMMRNTRFVRDDNYDSPALVQMGSILNERLPIQHIFGHVEVGQKFFKYNNHVAIDQGCSSGGHLTAYIIDLDTGITSFDHEVSKNPAPEPLMDFSYHIKPWTKVADLNPDQEKILRRMVRANPAFVSSTVSPSPAFFGEGHVPHLETTESAINLFLKRGVTKVIAQKKHMGSRCQVYLAAERENCYAISRNGFRIRIEAIEGILDNLFEQYKGQYTDLLILDGELLPWSALGRGLILFDFNTYHTAIDRELTMLNSSVLKDHVPDFDIESRLENIKLFKQQLDIYGEDVPVHYAPFGVVYCDGKELLTSDLTQTLSRFNIPFELFDLEQPNDIMALEMFYEQQVADGRTEGIVIKPVLWSEGEIPMIKIRNEEYLRLVYGFNYTDILEKHCHEKDIRGKLHLSIREQDLNLHLLNAYKTQNVEDQREIYKLLIVEFSKESAIDPRL